MSIISAGTSNTTTLVYTGDTTGNLVFQSNGTTEAMRITNTQRVGIGNTNPSTPLQVNGTITATSVNTNNTFGFKNRIINGAMVIDQRNGGASVTPANGAQTYTIDRWSFYVTQASKLTTQQNQGSVTPPAGFTNYAGVTSSSAYPVVASDFFIFYQWLEGFNTADLDFGKSTAKTITISFWVRSSLTGTFGGSILNSAQNRCYPFTYTISSANTWEQKAVTIAGDTTGTWVGATNGQGLGLIFGLGVGSTNSGTAGAWTSASQIYSATGATSVVGTNGATFYITGVQLEVGSTATSFDYRPYGTELVLCQRYYQKSFPVGTAPAQNIGGIGALYSQAHAANAPACGQIIFPVVMRDTPSTFTTFNTSAANANWRNLTASSDINVVLYSSSATGAFVSSNTQVMNQYAYAGIQWSATAEL